MLKNLHVIVHCMLDIFACTPIPLVCYWYRIYRKNANKSFVRIFFNVGILYQGHSLFLFIFIKSQQWFHFYRLHVLNKSFPTSFLSFHPWSPFLHITVILWPLHSLSGWSREARVEVSDTPPPLWPTSATQVLFNFKL